MNDNSDKLRTYLRKVTAELQASQARVRALEESAREPIAVVGVGCRYPGGVASAQDLWELARDGVDAVTEHPGDRGWFRGDDRTTTPLGTLVQGAGGYLRGAGDFDAGFFDMSDRAAMATDPQQRLLLETSWEALEDAGIDPLSLAGSRTGVFVGAFYRLYAVHAQTGTEPVDELVAGVAGAVIAGRVAYELGLEGPAATVDTACSASLVALHWACQSLRLGESELALAGGVAVNATPHMYTDFSRAIGLAPDGRCKPFAAGADGSGWSEGVGVLALERLSRARALGHRVLGLVRGTATARAGASNGLTAPNGQTQQRTVRSALADAGLGVDDVDVIEAHGSGTRLGDSIEAHAMLETYGATRGPADPLLMGSVKSNIGHAQSSSGIAGVVKMLEAMRHGRVPPTLHVDEPSPDIDWSSGKLALATDGVPWPDRGHPRRSAVSSFGISGTNVHVVLEQAPSDAPVAGGRLPVIPWALSAKSADALRAHACRLRDHVASRPDLDPLDVGLTLASRSCFAHRAVVTGADRDGLLDGLAALAGGTDSPAVVTGIVRSAAGPAIDFRPRAGLVGTGPQLPAFRRAFEEAGAAVEAHLVDTPAGADARRFVHQTALYRLLTACGVYPDVVLGDRPAAAHAAGSLTLTDAARLVVEPRCEVPAANPVTAILASAGPDLSARGVELVISLGGPPEPDAGAGSTVSIVRSTSEEVVSALARIHCRGPAVDWVPVFEGTCARRLSLPTYPFLHRRYWWVTPLGP